MRLHIAGSLLSVLCAWVLWEKWIVHNTGEATQRIIQAVSEAKTLDECRTAMPTFVKNRTEGFRKAYKESDYGVIEGPFGVSLTDKQRKATTQHYVFYCLPSTLDPYHEPQ
jgi:hypothetical protein